MAVYWLVQAPLHSFVRTIPARLLHGAHPKAELVGLLQRRDSVCRRRERRWRPRPVRSHDCGADLPGVRARPTGAETRGTQPQPQVGRLRALVSLPCWYRPICHATLAPSK